MSIPTDWTECEEYDGHIIAVKNGWYGVFSKNGLMKQQSLRTRAHARRWIETGGN